jgi:hypothetical protein
MMDKNNNNNIAAVWWIPEDYITSIKNQRKDTPAVGRNEGPLHGALLNWENNTAGVWWT